MVFPMSDQFNFGLGYPQDHSSNLGPRRVNPNTRIHRTYVPAFLQQTYMNHPYQPSFPMQGLPYYNTVYGGPYADDFEDSGEIATRPRLTKEQVDILEGEFVRNPKPNSSHKRDLAHQTGLELNRVSNWFQNRRAKAKQQRKQAEYENGQQSKRDEDKPSAAEIMAIENIPNSEDVEEEEEEDEIELNAHCARSISTLELAPNKSLHHASSHPSADGDLKQRSYDSLQRALKAADEAQAQKMASTQWSHVGLQMPAEIPFQPDTSGGQSSLAGNPMQNLLTTSWMHQHADQQQQMQHSVNSGDFNFDFGFDTVEPRMCNDTKPLPSPTDSGSHSVVSPGEWAGGQAITPTMAPPQGVFHQPLPSPGLPTPTYSSSRRGSTTEGLTSNFEGFAIDILPFNQRSTTAGSSDGSDNGNDIASRRRRPRPAALTSASLRSRSYGQLSAQSPTTRQGIPAVSAQSIRHVKSTGHSLHNHYAGIRKSSLPQRSPLNVSTFAEADLQTLMAQSAAGMMAQQQTPTAPQSVAYQQEQSQSGYVPPQKAQYDAKNSSQQIQSPPATPYQQDFFMQSASMLPPSIQAQYAYMPDYTPPYSAGPLTNSSWSDAPLTSPDIVNFPQMSFIPSLITDMQGDDTSNMWHFPNDISPHSRLNTESESKKAQFRIETFPNQDQEHAQISQHFNRTRPNHFVFQHFGQGDFSPVKS